MGHLSRCTQRPGLLQGRQEVFPASRNEMLQTRKMLQMFKKKALQVLGAVKEREHNCVRIWKLRSFLP